MPDTYRYAYTHSYCIQVMMPPKAIFRSEGIDLKLQGLQQRSILNTLFKSYLQIFQAADIDIFNHPKQIAQLQNPDLFFQAGGEKILLNQNYRPEQNIKKSQHVQFNITISYFTRKEMQNYNHSYRGKDYATNILTFPSFIEYLDDACIELNNESSLTLLNSMPRRIEQQIDLLLCPAIIHEEAHAQNKSLFSYYAHLYLHGLLHGFGFDHENEKDAEEMEALETLILKKLGFTAPY